MDKAEAQRRLQEIRMTIALIKAADQRVECETSLRAFVKASWPVIEPGTTYVHGFHIDAICEHLEAVVNGEIRKLIINISPRCMKSTLCSIAFPAWVWINSPERKFLYSSYGLHLSMRDSRKCNALIKSAWYQRNWSEKFKILTAKGGQDTKQRFDNDKGGFRIATATNVGTTGDGGDIIFYDDPNDLAQMNSDAYVEQVIFFHEHVMRSRLNDPKTGVRICIQQRSSERDMTGHILSTEQGWDHLVIPMEYEGSKKATSIGWTDPRKEHGDLMCEERIGPLEVADLKRNVIAWNGQYQQRPAPGEGAKFRREWIRFWNPSHIAVDPQTEEHKPVRLEVPGAKEPLYTIPKTIPVAFEQVLQSWDMNFKDAEENDLVSGQTWGRVGANCYLIGRRSGHFDFVRTLTEFRAMSSDFPCPEKLIEDKANGPAVVSTLKNEIPGIIPVTPEGDKVCRANAVTPYFESGNVYLPNQEIYPWVKDFIEQLCNFPKAKHDDDVDAMTQGLIRLFATHANAALPEFRTAPRVGEPQSACHVIEHKDLRLEPHWRRWISMTPGAALWLCETPTGSVRIYRELDLVHLDGYECGRRIAEKCLEDVRGRMCLVGRNVWVCEILMEKDLFKPMEPIGCLAELVSDGAQSYKKEDGTFEEREMARADFASVRFSAEMVEVIEGAWDRLRTLLRFAPPEFTKVSYDRNYAMDLFKKDAEQWRDYMAAVEGEPRGEWPKVKFSSECPKTLAAIGTASRIYKVEEIAEPFLRALLVGITIPDNATTVQPPREIPWGPNGPRIAQGGRRRRLGLRMAV
jgi:predicted phage terminase large subunit-like protein